MNCGKCGHRKRKGVDCKFCKRIRAAKSVRSLEGCLRKRYKELCARSARRGWPSPDFSEQQFFDRFVSDTVYLDLYRCWVSVKFKASYAPSVDRIDSTQPYLFSNIRIIRWDLNHRKAYKSDRYFGTVDPDKWNTETSPPPQSCEYPDEPIPDWL